MDLRPAAISGGDGSALRRAWVGFRLAGLSVVALLVVGRGSDGRGLGPSVGRRASECVIWVCFRLPGSAFRRRVGLLACDFVPALDPKP